MSARAITAVVVALLAAGCKRRRSPPPAPISNACAALEQHMAATLDAVDRSTTKNPDFTVMIERRDGRRFTHSHGRSSPTTRYESASSSKWVTAVVLLDLVDQGVLSLDSKPSQYFAYWRETQIDLRDLLSFTSGYGVEHPCQNNPNAELTDCVRKIHDANAKANPAAPGVEYDYGSTHMQIAGAMAMAATKADEFAPIFDAWKAKHRLFATAVYDLPSAQNPRLAGGMHWTGEEYLGFLRALYRGELLKPETMAALHANQRGTATVKQSAAWNEIGEDWSYALGNWIECPTAKTKGGFNCTAPFRNSSAGAYGAYPFIDFAHDYFGLVARQGRLTSADEGVAIFRSIEPVARRWVGCTP